MESRVALSWNLSSIHGWGIFGLNLVQQLIGHKEVGWPQPMLLADTAPEMVDQSLHDQLLPLIQERAKIKETPPQTMLADTLMLHSSGNHLLMNDVSASFRGARNIGFTFFETTDIPDQSITTAKSLDGMRTGSIWNRDFLISKGLKDVICIHQGVDIGTFKPGPRAGTFGERFTVFSGGKLEYRKGQDLVLAAFKKFHTQHPDSLLITNWQNPWPESMATLHESHFVTSVPRSSGNPADDLMRWTQQEGLPAGAHIDIGMLSNSHLPPLFREIDVAVFANRCEGGTNLVAMECMASGVPCVLSMNSGHLDIADEHVCYPLNQQRAVSGDAEQRRTWGESDVDEIVDVLEHTYTDRQHTKDVGRRGCERMQSMSWDVQISKLIKSFET